MKFQKESLNWSAQFNGGVVYGRLSRRVFMLNRPSLYISQRSPLRQGAQRLNLLSVSCSTHSPQSQSASSKQFAPAGADSLWRHQLYGKSVLSVQ